MRTSARCSPKSHEPRDVQEPDRAIGIGLRDERYAKLVIEVENPEQDIARVREAIAAAPTLATS